MSRHSAILKWEIHYGDMASYYCPFHKLISLSGNRFENLHSIVHEINECEVLFLLLEMGVGDIDIHVTKKMCKKYPWLFKRPAKQIIVTHIVSPYGQRNCALERKKNRLVWK